MLDIVDRTKPRPTPVEALSRRIEDRSAVVAVVGLGYVGLPLTLAAVDAGFPVLGLDSDTAKVAALRSGRSHITDISDGELRAVVGKGVRFTDRPRELAAADVVVLTVPTPLVDGGPDLSLIHAAAGLVAAALRPGQLVILESTSYPGTTEEVLRPLLEASGLTAGSDFWLAFSPERVNPGTDWNVRTTPKVIGGLGADDTGVARTFYGAFVDEVHTTQSPREAEMAKLIENTFRQVNIALVNELATIAPALGVDLWDALDAAATKPFGYLPFWPGPGVGGHCIAVDPSYLSWRVEQRLGFGVGFIQHALSVNNRMPGYVAGRIAEVLNSRGKATRGARVTVVGVTYKPDVNDVRESAALCVCDHLVGAGADLQIVDPIVDRVTIQGVEHTPVELSAGLSDADVVVVLTPHTDVDYEQVLDEASVVFDATGHLRAHKRENLVLL